MKHTNFGYCYRCGERYEEDFIIENNGFECPQCACNSIVLGSNFIRKNDAGGVLCTCLNDSFMQLLHIDYTDHSKTSYKCKKCSNCITIDTYREMN